jgi:hypothetical protein
MKRFLLLVAVLLCAAQATWARAHFVFGTEFSSGHHYYRSNGFSSFEVEFQGDIELSNNLSSIDKLSADAYLSIEQRRLVTLRKLRVTAGEGGRPVLQMTISGRRASAEDAARFLDRNLAEVVRVTSVGARPRARRIFEASGTHGVLDAISELESDDAKGIYFDELLSIGRFDAAASATVAQAAGREISSSSRLRRTLELMAGKLPPDGAVTVALARAAQEIGSSREHGAALAEIARIRGVEAETVSAFGASLREIDSSSQKGSAILEVSRYLRPGASLEPLSRSASTISSSVELHRCLAGLLQRPSLSESESVGALRAGAGIGSSAEKAALLCEFAPRMTLSRGAVKAYLETASTIDSSREKRRALLALAARRDLDAGSFSELFRAGSSVDSSHEKSELLALASETMPADPSAVSAFLDCARTIASSTEQRHAVLALLVRKDLSRDEIQQAISFAEKEIDSTSERDAVIREATRKLGR